MVDPDVKQQLKSTHSDFVHPVSDKDVQDVQQLMNVKSDAISIMVYILLYYLSGVVLTRQNNKSNIKLCILHPIL